MSQFAQQLKNEITRLAKKEIRSEQEKLKTSAAKAKNDIGALKEKVAALELQLKRLGKQLGQAAGSSKAKPVGEDSPNLRFRAGGFASLRKKLGLSAADMAKVLGVSAQSVYHWEIGKSRPQAKQLAAIAQARQLGKREVNALLAAKPDAATQVA